MLLKKHHIKIAKILNDENDLIDCYYHFTAEETLDSIVSKFTDYFEQDNPAFDVDKFNKAVYGWTKQ